MEEALSLIEARVVNQQRDPGSPVVCASPARNDSHPSLRREIGETALFGAFSLLRPRRSPASSDWRARRWRRGAGCWRRSRSGGGGRAKWPKRRRRRGRARARPSFSARPCRGSGPGWIVLFVEIGFFDDIAACIAAFCHFCIAARGAYRLALFVEIGFFDDIAACIVAFCHSVFLFSSSRCLTSVIRSRRALTRSEPPRQTVQQRPESRLEFTFGNFGWIIAPQVAAVRQDPQPQSGGGHRLMRAPLAGGLGASNKPSCFVTVSSSFPRAFTTSALPIVFGSSLAK